MNEDESKTLEIWEEGRFSFRLFEKGAGILQKEQNIPQNIYTTWFDYDTIVNEMHKELRGNYVRTAVINQKKNLIAPMDIVDILKN